MESQINNPIDKLIDDALKKCKTFSHMAKADAKALEQFGFDGQCVADLISNCESALKYAHMYQAYMNAVNAVEGVRENAITTFGNELNVLLK